jgi:hypothetical protein
MSSGSVALLFTEGAYLTGIREVDELFHATYPISTLVTLQYTVEPTSQSIDSALDDYFSKFPDESSNRCVLSELTAILVLIDMYFQRHDIQNVLCLTVSTTTSVITKIPYALTYAPPLRFQVMTQMFVIRDYRMKNVHILYQTDSLNFVFINEYRKSLKKQCHLLDISLREDALIDDMMTSYHFDENSAIIVLADTIVLSRYFTHQVLNRIPSSSYIALTNLNSDVRDIFQSVTAFVFVIAPIDYTLTTEFVQSSVKSSFAFYGVYGAYDTLLSLDSLLTFDRSFNVINYTNTKVSIPLSYANGAPFDLTTNSINYGNYDILFTKNVLLSCPHTLQVFLTCTSKGLGNSSLRDSYSVFRTAGFIPFFSNGFYYVLQNLSKIYREKQKELIAVKFEKNLATFILPQNGKKVDINIAESIPNRFSYSYDDDTGYFSLLQRIYQCGESAPCVNATMSKKNTILYIKEKL